MRAVARADGSVGRIFEGHLNGVERIAVAAPEPLRSAELRRGPRGPAAARRLGRRPGRRRGRAGAARRDGAAARAERREGLLLRRRRAAARARAGPRRAAGPPSLAYVDLSADVEIDRTWYRAGGMRASESHRVRFHGAPVLAVLGAPGELGREPWFSRDAIRTAAAWAGMADAAADAALADLAARGEPDDLRALGAGRIVTARATIDRWLEHAAARADAEPEADLRALSVQLREAIAGAARHAPRRGRARLRLAPVRDRRRRWTAPAATSSCSCSSTGSIRWSRRIGREALDVRPRLQARLLRRAVRARSPTRGTSSTSEYERAKYDATVAALDGRRYAPRARGRLLDRRAQRAPRGALRRAAGRRRRAGRRGRRARAPGRACPHVTVERRELPEDVPGRAVRADRLLGGPLLPRRRRLLERRTAAIGRELAPGGSLLAVHWRPDTRDLPADRATRSTSGSRPASARPRARAHARVRPRPLRRRVSGAGRRRRRAGRPGGRARLPRGRRHRAGDAARPPSRTRRTCARCCRRSCCAARPTRPRSSRTTGSPSRASSCAARPRSRRSIPASAGLRLAGGGDARPTTPACSPRAPSPPRLPGAGRRRSRRSSTCARCTTRGCCAAARGTPARRS